MRNTSDFDLALDTRVAKAIRALNDVDELLQLRPDALSDWQKHDLHIAHQRVQLKGAKSAA